MQLRTINPKFPIFTDSAGVPQTVAPLQASAKKKPTVKDLTLSNFKSQKFEASVMLNLGFDSLVSGKTDNNYSFFMFELSFVDPLLRIQPILGIDRAVQWGTSVRIGISVESTDNTASLNLAGLSASATVKGTSTSVEARFEGMSLALSLSLGSFITLGAVFDATMMNNIGKLVETFQQSVRSDPSSIIPTSLQSADLMSAADLKYHQGVSAAYAIHRIKQSQKLQNALDRLDDKLDNNNTSFLYSMVDPWLVRSVYNKISDGNPFDKPSDKTKKNAIKIADNTKA